MWEYMNSHGWWLGFGVVHMVLFWGLIILAIVALVKILFSDRENDNPKRQQPVEILKMRYARGEIDTEEFRRKKQELDAPGGGKGQR